ncbi:MAG: hypothetical protein KC680_04660 [Candidatus Peregrinibacteria bacterium]|nr:hypothetical protein [Candidatus Peregrinibacteria bacterium]MCB9808224.1 hypothetical protein [Candidatus Peribacteria bacterium]
MPDKNGQQPQLDDLQVGTRAYRLDLSDAGESSRRGRNELQTAEQVQASLNNALAVIESQRGELIQMVTLKTGHIDLDIIGGLAEGEDHFLIVKKEEDQS